MNKILVIEDDIVIKDTICDILEAKGYQVESAINGYEGLATFAKEQIDLVICDVHMPLMDGYDTIKKFRESAGNLLTPFLFLSALATNENVRTGMNLGADDYITKPFDYKELLKTVERLLYKYYLFKENCRRMQEQKVHNAIIAFKKRIRYKLREHVESLNHAKLVQSSILPKRLELEELFVNYGLFHSPKEIVSGDFYWAREIEGKKLIAVGDCTGHGVPAALMTMVCSNMMSIAVERFGLVRPGEILKKTNELVVEFMHSNNTMLNNGMDIALCSIDTEQSFLHFAGAKRPLYFISNDLVIEEGTDAKVNSYPLKDKFLFRIKGGVESIGSKVCNDCIQEHTINYQKSDLIYLTSDGFCDQFGGFRGKKYNAKRFVNLLEQIMDKSPSLQESGLRNSFLHWKGDSDQTDDVTIFLHRL